MNVDEMLAIFDREQRRDVRFPDVRPEPAPGLIRLLTVDGKSIVITYSDLSDENADSVIEREIEYASGLGRTLSWKAYTHDRPADLRERLVRKGFTAEELEAVMVLDTEEAPPELLRPLNSAVDIRRIAGPADIGPVIALETEVWGTGHDWLRDLARETEASPEHLAMYCAYAGGVPASAGWIRFNTGTQFASLWGGSTLPAYRRRGLYTALLALRVQEAIRRGFRFITIDASPMSRPIVEKHGFRLITHAQDHDWEEKRV